MKNKILLAGLICASLMSPVAFSQELRGGFVRGDIGRSEVNVDGTEKDTSYGLRGGYFFTPNFGIEAGYNSLFNKTWTDTFMVGDSPVSVQTNTKFSGITLGVVGKYNFGGTPHEGFYLGGRAGLMRGKSEGKVSVPAVGSSLAYTQTYSDSSNSPYIGVSAGYDFTQNLGLSLNFDRYRGDASDGDHFNLNTTGLGLEYRF